MAAAIWCRVRLAALRGQVNHRAQGVFGRLREHPLSPADKLDLAIHFVGLYLFLIRILLSGFRVRPQGAAPSLTACTEETAMKFPLCRRGLQTVLVIGLVAGVLWSARAARTDDKPAPDKVAVERARTTVKMLDDLYKGFIVNITETYVRAKEKTPAARVAKKVFKYMEQKDGTRAGWWTPAALR